MKEYCAFLKAPELEPHHQMPFIFMLRTIIGRMSLTHLQRCSRRIVQPQSAGLLYSE